jgi:hypothetical protein
MAAGCGAVLVLVLAAVAGRGPLKAGAAVPQDAATPPSISPDIRFGAVEAYQAPTRATQAGVRWERLTFTWSQIQPASPLDWVDPYTTRFLTDEASRGRAVVGMIMGTPAWAASNPSQGAIAVPKGLDRPYNDALNTWAIFVGRLVQRYRGLVKTWFIWDEPDRNSSSVQHTWAGTIADYYQLLKTAYQAAKTSDPTCQVVVGGLTYWWDKENNRPQFLDSLLAQADADPTARANNGYFDGVGLHVYNNPLNSYTVPVLFKRLLAAHGYRKAIWIDETNVAPFDDSAGTLPRIPFRASLSEQASYIVESYALALAAGLRRISVYRMVDDATGADAPDHFGLVRLDGSLRPAYAAYQTVTSMFGGTTSAYYTWHDDGSAPSTTEIDALLDSDATRAEWVWPAAVNRVVLRQDDRQVTVVWDASPASAQVSLPVSGHDAVLIDKAGVRTSPPVGADGRYHLFLEGSTSNSDPRDTGLYLVGGSPLILQETGVTTSATPPPVTTPTITATSTATATATAPVTATTSLTSTAAATATATPTVAVPSSPTPENLSAGATGGAARVLPLPASADALYFTQTGHNVAGAFRSVFTQFGGLATFGYPRTEAFHDNGPLVQYFQNAEVECTHLCRDPAYTATVAIAPAGQTLVDTLPPFPQATRLDSWGDTMYFSATGHNLAGPFLDYWRANSGAVLLGAPLSEPFAEVESGGNGQVDTLQYFQRGALTFRPAGPGHSFIVVPAPVGDVLLRQRGWLP